MKISQKEYKVVVTSCKNFYKIKKSKMKKSKLIFVIYPLLILTLMSAISCFNKSPGKKNSSSKTAWINLFNGSDLSGWVQVEGTAKYTVENEQIIGTTVPAVSYT